MHEPNLPNSRTRHAAIFRAGLIAHALAATAAFTLAHHALAQSPFTTASVPQARDAVDAFADPALPIEDRLNAARRFVQMGDTPVTRDRFAELIRGPIDDTSTAGVLVRAVSLQSTVPASLYSGLAKRLSTATDAERPLLLSALSSFHTRPAAMTILLQCGLGADPASARAGFDALARLSGRDDIPDDAQAWARWLDSVERLDEANWRSALATALADRADRLARRGDLLASTLATSLRRLHLKMTEEERSPFLASVLADPSPEVRDLGFELVARELAAGTPLQQSVAEAAAKLLNSSDAIVRSQAARLLGQLAPEFAARPIADALSRETDPTAAAAMMDAVARWPGPETGPLVVRWLSSEPGVRRAAIAASWTLYRAGLLGTTERARVLTSLRTIPLETLGSAACQLLASMGDDNDRRIVGSLLTRDDTSLRRSAANALANDAAFADAILDAARSDPEMFTIATRVVLMHRLDESGFELLRALPAPSAIQHRDGLLRVAKVLPAPAALRIARATPSPDDREAFLELLVSDSRIMSERYDEPSQQAIIEAALALANHRMATGRADLAITALDAVMPIATDAQKPALVDTETIACIVNDRIDDAANLRGSAEAWLKGLRIIAEKPQARDALAAFTFRFTTTLTESQMKELAEIIASIERATAARRSANPPPVPQSP